MRTAGVFYGSLFQYMLNAANSGNCCNFRGRPSGRVEKRKKSGRYLPMGGNSSRRDFVVPSWSTGWVAVTSCFLFRGAELLA